MANDDLRNSIIWQICVPNFMLVSTSEIVWWIIYVSRYTFAVPDKSADQICNLLIDEIFPRHGQVLELCSDSGTEYINYKVKETFEALNIHHV